MNNKKLKWGLAIGGVLSNVIAVLCLFLPFISFMNVSYSGFGLLKEALYVKTDVIGENIVMFLFYGFPVILSFTYLFMSIIYLAFMLQYESGRLKKRKNKPFGYGRIIIGVISSFFPLVLFLLIPTISTSEYIVYNIGPGAILCGLFLSFGILATDFANLDFKNFNNNRNQQGGEMLNQENYKTLDNGNDNYQENNYQKQNDINCEHKNQE